MPCLKQLIEKQMSRNQNLQEKSYSKGMENKILTYKNDEFSEQITK